MEPAPPLFLDENGQPLSISAPESQVPEGEIIQGEAIDTIEEDSSDKGKSVELQWWKISISRTLGYGDWGENKEMSVHVINHTQTNNLYTKLIQIKF